MKFSLGGVALAACVVWGCGGTGSPVTPGSGGASGGGSGGSGGAAGTGGSAGSGGSGGANVDGGSDAQAGTDAAADGPKDTAGDGGTDVVINDNPTLLSETGLYANIANGTLAPGVFPFQPQYQLWSDSATKRRWIQLPAGSKIDTSDMNFWDYPRNTKVWKEFSRDGVRVETRLLWKRSPGVWFMMAYKWNTARTEATAVAMGEANALGTMHDIPSKEQCSTCHSGLTDIVLGFSALQLSHNLGGAEELNLDKIKTMQWLSDPPATNPALPGDAADKAALGYLHANCGMCHNERSRVYMTSADLDLWTHVEQLATLETTRAYLSMLCDEWPGAAGKLNPIKTCGVGHATGRVNTGAISRVAKRVVPGNAMTSSIWELMNLRETVNAMAQMPPVGTEITDPAGLMAVRTWIMKLTVK